MAQWLARARREILAADEHDSVALTNLLPVFLDRLVEAISRESRAQNEADGWKLSGLHGVQRAALGNYTLEQIMAEYDLLEEIVVSSLKSSGPLSVEDLITINRWFRNAVREAVSAFVRTLGEKHRESEIQFRRLVEDAKDMAIFIVSPEGIIKTWNEGATRIKQFSAEDALGRHFRMLYCEQDRAEGRPETNLKMAAENGRFEEQWWRIRKDGSRWWADVIVTAIYSPTGEITGFSKIVRDLTEKKRADDALREAKAAAEQASLLKSTFVANMSHEIRTPLGAILGFSEVLLEPNLAEAERIECSQVIRRNGRVLLRLIEDILDISKIEAGKLDIEFTRIPVRPLLTEVVSLFEEKAKSKGISLVLDIEREMPDYMTTDSVRLRQIISNLLGNAIKFTETGGIHMIARPHQVDAKRDGMEILIADTGPGIPADKRDRIFGQFSQADASVTRKYGGTGLGLALSRDLARQLGGDIELLDCALGCTFRITIVNGTPTVDSQERRTEIDALNKARAEAATYPHVKGSRILLVEDAPDNQALIKRILSKAGAEVELARNGLEGIQAASKSRFDAVLMDVQMPVLDGHSATARLRGSGYNRPIIALTAHAMLEDRLKSMRSGCDDYLTKPVSSVELLHVLEKWVRQIHH